MQSKIIEQIQEKRMKKHQDRKASVPFDAAKKEEEGVIGDEELAAVVGGLNLQPILPDHHPLSGSSNPAKSSLLLIEDEADALFGKR